MEQRETRRILIDGVVTTVTVDGDALVAGDGQTVTAVDATHLPPVQPSKIICVHLNYRSRLEELGREQPSAPTYFHKPVSCLNSHGGAVIRPPGCKYLNYEGEIAAVIGRTTRGVTPDEVPAHLAGFTIANDYGLHDFRDTDAGSMLRVKGTDSLGAVGPGLVTGWDYRGKTIRTLVDGEVVQEASTDDLLWSIEYLVADLARSITFEPGDLILTGTPANSRPVDPGSIVSVEVDGLGVLENRIVEAGQAVAAGYGAQPTESEEVLSVALGDSYVGAA